MRYFIVAISPGVFLTFLSIIIFKKLFQLKVSRMLYKATLISYIVALTIMSLLGNSETDIYIKINTWSLFMTISSFVAVCIAVFKYGKKAFYYTSGSLTLIYLISIINTIIFQGLEMVLNGYLLLYKTTFLIFMVIYIIKKNEIAVLIGKTLLVLHTVHIVIRAVVNATSVGSAIFEIILLLLLSSILIIPIYIWLNKRVIKARKNNVGINDEDINKSQENGTIAIQENILDDIVD